MPEEVTAVMWRRKNTASSCQNTQSVVITASLPNTGTRNYRCLENGLFCTLLSPPQSNTPAELWVGSFQLKCTVEMWWGLSSPSLVASTGHNQLGFGTEGSICVTRSGELVAFCSELRETLQSDNVACFSGPKSVLILFAYF